jgi:hypothetical protein
MPANKRGQNWKVKDGKVMLEVPAVAAKSEEVPVTRLDRELERTTKRKARATEQLAEAQKALDDLTAYESELQALRDQIGD